MKRSQPIEQRSLLCIGGRKLGQGRIRAGPPPGRCPKRPRRWPTGGYVPTERAFENGGYETHRSVFTSRLARNAGSIIVDNCALTLERCREFQQEASS